MWKKIAGFTNYSVNENGEVRNDATGALKRPTINKGNGYRVVDLYEGNRRKKVTVHRLVANAFIPNPENKPTVDHIDGDRTNNNVHNLRWATYGEQNSRFETNGVRSQRIKATHFIEYRNKRGGRHEGWGNVDVIRYFESITACAEFFGCTVSNISLRLEDGDIGRRGRTRAWLIEYEDGERHTLIANV